MGQCLSLQNSASVSATYALPTPFRLTRQIKVSGDTVWHNAHRLELIFPSSGVALD